MDALCNNFDLFSKALVDIFNKKHAIKA